MVSYDIEREVTPHTGGDTVDDAGHRDNASEPRGIISIPQESAQPFVAKHGLAEIGNSMCLSLTNGDFQGRYVSDEGTDQGRI